MVSLINTTPTSTYSAIMSPGAHKGTLDEDTQVAQLLTVATTVLHQAVDLVENHLTSDDQLTVDSKFLPGSTIGKHLRHARDHFVILLECISSPPPHVFSYDIRPRNTPMESSLRHARDALLDTITQLEVVAPGASPNKPLTLNAITPYVQTLETTFGRELWFTSLHCVHHWSMVRVICGELNVQLSEDFGFAPSTLVHQGREAPLGKAKI